MKKIMFMILVMLGAVNIFAAGPGTITYQGTVVLPGGGIPTDGSYAMMFSLWDIESGGTEGTNMKWSEKHIPGRPSRGRASCRRPGVPRRPGSAGLSPSAPAALRASRGR